MPFVSAATRRFRVFRTILRTATCRHLILNYSANAGRGSFNHRHRQRQLWKLMFTTNNSSSTSNTHRQMDDDVHLPSQRLPQDGMLIVTGLVAKLEESRNVVIVSPTSLPAWRTWLKRCRIRMHISSSNRPTETRSATVTRWSVYVSLLFQNLKSSQVQASLKECALKRPMSRLSRNVCYSPLQTPKFISWCHCKRVWLFRDSTSERTTSELGFVLQTIEMQ